MPPVFWNFQGKARSVPGFTGGAVTSVHDLAVPDLYTGTATFNSLAEQQQYKSHSFQDSITTLWLPS